jgi:hypothetical protein
MSKRAFDKIMRGLLDAQAYLDGTGDKSRYRVHYASGKKTALPKKASRSEPRRADRSRKGDSKSSCG